MKTGDDFGKMPGMMMPTDCASVKKMLDYVNGLIAKRRIRLNWNS